MKNNLSIAMNWLSILVVGVICSGCALPDPTFVKVARIQQPPPGKALVNFHRLSNYNMGQAFLDQSIIGGVYQSSPAGADIWNKTFAVFDGNGKMLIDMPALSLFQYVCDPGDRVFIGTADHVSLVKATVAADKVYDIMIDMGVGMGGNNVYLTPLATDNKRKAKVKQFEKKEKLTINLNANSQEATKFEISKQSQINLIKADFLGGTKSDRVQYLRPDDCR